MRTSIILILSILFLLSCAKKENPEPTSSQNPLVKTLSYDSILKGSYWYDSQKRLTCSRTVESSVIDSTVYAYGNNSLEKLRYHDGVLIEIEHGILENGNIISINGLKADSSTFWSTYYTYDENGFLIREIHLDNDTIETWRVEYQILNGNVISMNRSNYLPLVCTYEYYPGTNNSFGSMENIDRFAFYKSKNLVKKVHFQYAIGNPGEEDYNYEYYANGWVKKMTSTQSSQTLNKYFTYW